MSKFNFPEGATPIDDCSGLIPTWVQDLADLNRVEAENISFAQRKYLRNRIDEPSRWLSPNELQSIHYDMFSDVWQWAGKFRKSQTSIGIEPFLISHQLAILCAEIKAWSQEAIELTFLERAAKIHHGLVAIHPFENGNGRFSRLIADRYLSFWKCPHAIWPSNLQFQTDSRVEYIQSLKEADHGNYAPLINLMHDYGARDPSLSDILSKPFFKKNLLKAQKISLLKALLRCKYVETGLKHPLQIAIKDKFDEAAHLLIDNNADIHFRDKSGFDPFERPCCVNAT